MNLPMVSRKRFKALQASSDPLRGTILALQVKLDQERKPLYEILRGLVDVTFDMSSQRVGIKVELAPELFMFDYDQREMIAETVALRLRHEIAVSVLLPLPQSEHLLRRYPPPPDFVPSAREARPPGPIPETYTVTGIPDKETPDAAVP